jgi:hypothetical protein
MKQFTKIAVLFMALLTLNSCKKYLDIEPVGRVIPTTTEDFRALLTSAYDSFSGHKSLLAVRGDELVMNEYGYDFPGYKDIYKWNDNNPDAVTLPMQYLSFYNTIFYANEVIASVEDRAGKSAETAQMKGEAYLLRAYSHFELANLYAKPYNKSTAATDRGIVLTLKMDLEENKVPATVAAVYEQVLADIKQGQQFLNVATFDAGKNYRFTTRAAYALAARVYEYQGDWSNAAAAVKSALQLNNKLEDLNVAGSRLPNHYLAAENIMSMENAFNSQISGASYISPSLLNAYDKVNDLRFAKYFSFSDGDYVSLKGADDALKISFRNGELYLIAAEAALQQDQLDVALTNLLTLKAARLTPAYYQTESSRLAALGKADLLAEILLERKRELALEGHRWYDLRRYGQPSITHEVEGETYTLAQGDPRYTIKFPQAAITNNPNLR